MAKTFSQQTVDGVTYLVCDKEARESELSQRGSLASGNNINDVQFTKNGQWMLTADQMDPPPTNWPSTEQGRLIAFGGTSNNQAIRAQMVVDRLSRVFVRYVRNDSFSEWREAKNMIVSTAISTGTYNDLDTFPLDSVITVTDGRHALISNFPVEYHVGGVVFTYGTQKGNVSGYENAVQRIVFNNQATSAWRMYKDDAWGEWVYDGVVEIVYRCKQQGTGEPRTFTNLAYGLRYLMQNFDKWNEHYRAIIDIEAGEFDYGASVVDYIEEETLDNRGLFLPPYCTMRGAGKDKTKLVCNYSGTDETFMFYVSGLNVPYESVLEGFTLTVKNLRYTIHSDRGMEHMPGVTVDDQASLLRDTRITVRDVRLINEGFEDGKQGTDPSTGNPYVCPACWGSGSWNNTIQEFYGCEFIANKYQAWFNHNRATLTEASKFIFESCIFVNGSSATPGFTSNYASFNMISWGSGIKNEVILRDCFLNRFAALTVRTDMGNTNAVSDYNLTANTSVPVFEGKTNNSHLADNFITADCKPEMAGNAVTAYTPVSKAFVFDNVHTYNSAEDYVGIAVNSASAGGKVNVQYSGLVYLELLKTGGFAAGTNIGYNGSTWVEDNTHPIVRALSTLVGEILE